MSDIKIMRDSFLEDNGYDIILKAQIGCKINDVSLTNQLKLCLENDFVLETLQRIMQKLSCTDLLDQHERLCITEIAKILNLDPISLLQIIDNQYYPERELLPLSAFYRFTSQFNNMIVNSYIIWDIETCEAALIDTGSDPDQILEFIAENFLKLKYIFITHAHTDHIFCLDFLLEKTNAIALISEKEKIIGAQIISEGDKFFLGNHREIETYLVAGHSPGGMIYFLPENRPFAFVGDILYAGSLGKVSFNYETTIHDILKKIFLLPPNTILCPGHGLLTSVQQEKVSNPFFAPYTEKV